MDRRVLRTPGAAAYIGLAASTLEKARLAGWGPPFMKLGRVVGYDMRDLDAWLEQRKGRGEVGRQDEPGA
jgi:predicted DNA-binding transcriptional regulator AlpA